MKFSHLEFSLTSMEYNFKNGSLAFIFSIAGVVCSS